MQIDGMSEVLEWFSSQLPYARIECLVQILSQCLPIEMRYISCHVLASRSDVSPELIDFERKANDATMWNDPNIDVLHNIEQRGSVSIALALLDNDNHVTANAIYKHLLALAPALQSQPDSSLAADILLLYSMARHHAALQFRQRAHISACLDEHGVRLTRIANGQSPVQSVPTLYPTSSTVCKASSTTGDTVIPDQPRIHKDRHRSTSAPADANDQIASTSYEDNHTVTDSTVTLDTVYPSSVEIMQYHIKQPETMQEAAAFHVPMLVKLSTNIEFVTYKTYENVCDLHRALLEFHPSEAGCHGNKRVIPYLPKMALDLVMESHNWLGVWTDQVARISDYIYELNKLPPQIMATKCIVEFFAPPEVPTTEPGDEKPMILPQNVPIHNGPIPNRRRRLANEVYNALRNINLVGYSEALTQYSDIDIINMPINVLCGDTIGMNKEQAARMIQAMTKLRYPSPPMDIALHVNTDTQHKAYITPYAAFPPVYRYPPNMFNQRLPYYNENQFYQRPPLSYANNENGFGFVPQQWCCNCGRAGHTQLQCDVKKNNSVNVPADYQGVSSE